MAMRRAVLTRRASVEDGREGRGERRAVDVLAKGNVVCNLDEVGLLLAEEPGVGWGGGGHCENMGCSDEAC